MYQNWSSVMEMEMCCCSGIKTRSKVQEYANICPDCQKKLRSEGDLAKYRELREVLVVSTGSEEEDPIYENPVDNAGVVRVEVERAAKEGNMSCEEDLAKMFQALMIKGDKEGLRKLIEDIPPVDQMDPRAEPPLNSTLSRVEARGAGKEVKQATWPIENLDNQARLREDNWNAFLRGGGI